MRRILRHHVGWDLSDRRTLLRFTEHSSKDCWCGGHNLNNVKSNTNHNSIKVKLNRRKIRKYIIKLKIYGKVNSR